LTAYNVEKIETIGQRLGTIGVIPAASQATPSSSVSNHDPVDRSVLCDAFRKVPQLHLSSEFALISAFRLLCHIS
ncbi:MAG: hypothetical protein WBX30_12930, partial [Stellaceae bacterium]